ncbi:hypothetical protein D9758_013316 [Tetrapyrgos nigripes]|uniref:F-box domain-containing protein n=1 Tax=Tetrapyrgos nigripes TaxID=182062 RepID=A0A8H5CEW8_9AGAR|nr:hypothetical protein D9758_013316 [Tetrapyrgos nigripes]
MYYTPVIRDHRESGELPVVMARDTLWIMAVDKLAAHDFVSAINMESNDRYDLTRPPPGLSVDRTEIVATTLVISQTCSFWRKTALGIPELWSDLSLKIAIKQPDTTGDLVNTYLQRSGPSLLSFAISAEDTDLINPFCFRCLWPILRSLFDDSDRWQSASFRFNREFLMHVDRLLQHKADSPLPGYAKLKALSIVSDLGYVSDSRAFFGIWERAPLLQSLKINTFDSFTQVLNASDSLSDCLQTPFFRTASGLSVLDVIQLLMNHPSLEEFNFNIEDSRDSYNFYYLPSPFSHSRLRSFTCEVVSSNIVCNLLSCFTLPSLTTLALRLPPLPFEDGLRTISSSNTLKDMIQRSGCCLQVLKLGGGPFTAAEELVEILTLTPTVTFFELDAEEYIQLLTPIFFQSLTIVEDDPTTDSPLAPKVLPKLECFRLRFFEDPFPFENLPQFDPLPNPPLPEAILSLVTSRRTLPANSPIAKLARFDLYVSFRTDNIGREWVESFRSNVELHLQGEQEEEGEGEGEEEDDEEDEW